MPFAPSWTAEVLLRAPMIAPVRQFTYPMNIAGEEDALARGALLLMVKPATGGTFLATCALGFTNPAMPTGVFSCPNPDELCAVAGGYAYLIDTLHPERCTLLTMKPVGAVLEAEELLLFIGFHAIQAWGWTGLAWETKRLSWEGLRITTVAPNEIVGFGWNLQTDKEVEFRVDLRTGIHTGGAF